MLERLPLRGDETVLDAGCGSGRVTASLMQRLARGRAIAVDRSPGMLAEARHTLAGWGDRVQFIHADLLSLPEVLPEPVDAVFSTATFHWIDDHDTLFRVLFQALRPGGFLAAQCGGAGNIERFIHHGDAVSAREPFAPFFRSPVNWHHRATAEDTASRLRAAGFYDVRTWLEPSPQAFDRKTFEEFIRTVVLGRHLERLPDALRHPFAQAITEEVAQQEGEFVLDYVRLNLDARRQPG